MNDDLHEISAAIGELRSARLDQITANSRIIDEMRTISARLTSIVELNATFVEYRKSTHERFAKVHEMFAHSDLLMERTVTTLERVNDRLDGHDLMIAAIGNKLDNMWKIIATAAALVSTLVAGLSGWFPAVLQKLFP